MPADLSPEQRTRALAAGLDVAVRDFPADVAEAAAAAGAAARSIPPPDDPVAEPWPPMRTGYPA